MARAIPSTLIGETASQSFDSSVYSLTAVQKAALKFSDRAAFTVQRAESAIVVTMALFADADLGLTQLVQLLQNEALDQVLRETLAAETAVERQLILSYAFSRSKLSAE